MNGGHVNGGDKELFSLTKNTSDMREENWRGRSLTGSTGLRKQVEDLGWNQVEKEKAILMWNHQVVHVSDRCLVPWILLLTVCVLFLNKNVGCFGQDSEGIACMIVSHWFSDEIYGCWHLHYLMQVSWIIITAKTYHCYSKCSAYIPSCYFNDFFFSSKWK